MIRTKISASNFECAGAWLYLDEVQHRVLNEYTAMLSTLRLAALKISDAEVGLALNDITRRLHESALVFRALSPPHNLSLRDLGQELESLCAAISGSRLADGAIRLTLAAEPAQISAQRCWKICLVVAELVTNAARHAFHRRQGGLIVVELSVHAGMIRCTIVDNGAAPATIAPGRGSAILDAIAGDIGGTIIRNHTNNGSAVVLQAPMKDTAGGITLESNPGRLS